MNKAAQSLSKQRWAKPDARSKEKRGGRPRSTAPRCPCGAMTNRRAEARGHKCSPGTTEKVT